MIFCFFRNVNIFYLSGIKSWEKYVLEIDLFKKKNYLYVIILIFFILNINLIIYNLNIKMKREKKIMY